MAVVRCPVCRGASRVRDDALGYRVACPRCPATFVAGEELPSERPAAARAPRPAKVIPIAPPRRFDVPVASEVAPAPAPTDPVHDPHGPAAGGLPVSVLVGMALVPFGIPLFWRIAPLLTKQEPALSLAVPLALAVAAAALCLGVVYTIDWTPATRVKGVLMLVALAYLSAAGLYFLKRDLVEVLQNLLGPQTRWVRVASDSGGFRVQMPTAAEQVDEQPLPGVPMAGGRRAKLDTVSGDTFTFFVTATPTDKPQPAPGDDWFNAIELHLAKSGRPVEKRVVTEFDFVGREWRIELDSGNYRIVRVYTAKNRVFYMSAEGPNLETDNELAKRFFGSLEPIADAKPARR